MEDGKIGLGGATKFFGVYAGRVVSRDANDAQLGRVYERKLVEEIVHNGIRDTEWEKPPGEDPKKALVSLAAMKDGNSITL